MTTPKRTWPQRSLGALVIVGLALAGQPAPAKEILKGVEPSENRVFIRTDGLACYFCAYGLERFFKKTGRIAAFDMHMQEGLVEAVFVRGEPLVPAKTLTRFVYDAGFSPRWIDAELVGDLQVAAGDSVVLRLRETGELIPLDDTSVLQEYLSTAAQGTEAVRVRGRASEDEDAPMRLAPESIRGVAAS